MVFLFICIRIYGPLRGPTSSSCGGLWPRLFLELSMLPIILIFVHETQFTWCSLLVCYLKRRYSPLRGLISSSAESYGRGYFFGQKKRAFMLLVLILGQFCCSLVPSVTLSSDLSNFNKNPKKSKHLKKINKIK